MIPILWDLYIVGLYWVMLTFCTLSSYVRMQNKLGICLDIQKHIIQSVLEQKWLDFSTSECRHINHLNRHYYKRDTVAN